MRSRLPLLVFLLGICAPGFGAIPIMPGTPLPEERDTHGSAVVGNRLFVVGGCVTKEWRATASVKSAVINPDRTIGPWTDSTPLPRRTLYIGTSVVANQNRLYVVGGQHRADENAGDQGDKRPIHTALFTTVNPDGTLVPWRESGAWDPTAGYLSSAAAVNSRTLYVSGGGTQDDTPSKRVFMSPLSASGEPGAWVEATPLPVGLWFHQMAIHGETLFALSGRSSPRADGQNMRVFSNRILADGTLGIWETLEGDNPASTFQGAYTSTGNYVFGIGGKDRNWFLADKVTFGRLSPAGISDWQTISAAPLKLERAAAAASGEFGALYITGGRTDVDYRTMSAGVSIVPLKKDSELVPTLSPDYNCMLPYEAALSRIRETGGRILLLSVSAGSERTTAFAREFCQMPVEPGVQRAYLVLSQSTEEARRFRLLQAGLIVEIDAQEKVLRRTTEPYTTTLQEF